MYRSEFLPVGGLVLGDTVVFKSWRRGRTLRLLRLISSCTDCPSPLSIL